jgi:hypothetical protein
VIICCKPSLALWPNRNLLLLGAAYGRKLQFRSTIADCRRYERCHRHNDDFHIAQDSRFSAAVADFRGVGEYFRSRAGWHLPVCARFEQVETYLALCAHRRAAGIGNVGLRRGFQQSQQARHAPASRFSGHGYGNDGQRVSAHHNRVRNRNPLTQRTDTWVALNGLL